jgi:hypothetical protein
MHVGCSSGMALSSKIGRCSALMMPTFREIRQDICEVPPWRPWATRLQASPDRLSYRPDPMLDQLCIAGPFWDEIPAAHPAVRVLELFCRIGPRGHVP